jgi:hypothetical protein
MKAGEKQGKARAVAVRKTDTQPSHPLADYLGDYEHPGYGVISFRQAGDRMQAVLNDKMSFEVSHYHYDTFDLHYVPQDEHNQASFVTDVNGQIAQVDVQFEPSVGALHFKRLPPTVDASLLAACAGVYEWMDNPLTVLLRNPTTLALVVPGQLERELIPYRDMEFTLNGLTGYSLEFKREADGSINEAILIQPGMVLNLRKRVSA